MNENYEFKIHVVHKNYNFQIIVNSEIVSKANADKQSTIWHLSHIYTYPQYRGRKYGSILLQELCKYLWSVEALPIIVHPAIGEKVIEELAQSYKQLTEKYTQTEIDEMTAQLEEDSKKPGFWEEQEKNGIVIDSKNLVKWYIKNGFVSDQSDLNSKILYRYPESLK